MADYAEREEEHHHTDEQLRELLEKFPGPSAATLATAEKVVASERRAMTIAQSSGARDRDVWVNTKTGEQFEVTVVPGTGWTWP